MSYGGYGGGRSTGDHVDTYQSYPAFDLNDHVFKLLTSLIAFSKQASYDVCILTFTQEVPILHWSIYLQSEEEDGGPVYDVWWLGGDRWERKEARAAQVTQLSSVRAGRTKPSDKYVGGTNLGTINDLEEFQRVIKATPLPRRGENCQSWVKNVVRAAVKRGLLEQDAVEQLEDIPTHPE